MKRRTAARNFDTNDPQKMAIFSNASRTSKYESSRASQNWPTDAADSAVPRLAQNYDQRTSMMCQVNDLGVRYHIIDVVLMSLAKQLAMRRLISKARFAPLC